MRVHCNGVQPRNQALLWLDLPAHAVLLDVRILENLSASWRDEESWTQDCGYSLAGIGRPR